MLRTFIIGNVCFFRRSVCKVTRTGSRLLSPFIVKDVSAKRLQKFVWSISPNTSSSNWNTNCVRYYADYPTHIKVSLPALSPTMESGTIISWEKKEGDKVNEGDLLAEIETDKATMGFETPEEGYLAKIVVQAGTKNVPIGRLVCIIVQEQSDVAAFKDFKDESAPLSPREPEVPIVRPPLIPAGEGEVKIRSLRALVSPMAKKFAEAQKLRLEGKGSGVHGSIKSDDLSAQQSSVKQSSDKESTANTTGQQHSSTGLSSYVDKPVSNIRGVIAKRLLESKQQIPHYYLTIECNMDKLLSFRADVNRKYMKDGVRVSVNDFIIKACAIACRKVPECNSYWMGNVIREFDNVDVSVAVATDTGLITPIVFSADRKGILEISTTVKDLALRARSNKLQPEEYQGGTVCISNLGTYNIKHFCAIINPPQSCILAIGGTSKKLVSDSNSPNGFKEINVMNVTLSADHRVVDGAVGAKWMNHFRDFMLDPSNMIL